MGSDRRWQRVPAEVGAEGEGTVATDSQRIAAQRWWGMADSDKTAKTSEPFTPPHPGSQAMPRWDAAELPPAPHLTPRSWALLLGPGLVAAGAAIGGGEWLAGPLTTARYGGAILWLSTISILAQVVY